jgi:hypothetical protein
VAIFSKPIDVNRALVMAGNAGGVDDLHRETVTTAIIAVTRWAGSALRSAQVLQPACLAEGVRFSGIPSETRTSLCTRALFHLNRRLCSLGAIGLHASPCGWVKAGTLPTMGPCDYQSSASVGRAYFEVGAQAKTGGLSYGRQDDGAGKRCHSRGGQPRSDVR